jgi:glycosyltransferase XagB
VGADGEEHQPQAFALAPREGARIRGLSAFQAVSLAGLVALFAWAATAQAASMAGALVVALHLAFTFCAVWRIVLVLASRRPAPSAPTPAVWPTYTVLAALYDEAEVLPQLVGHLSRLDYPTDRLEGYLVLEAHDHATRAAAERLARPDWLRILIVPPGSPQTKPRALNHALARARGEVITVYDAEDAPEPGQLREAAARFVADPSGRLACVQAPLRIRRHGPGQSPFLDRQFALEYAALFEVTLPGMARLGLPFPLGGTSNHFRADVLRAVGGWDAHNVTEDADLGFRLWRHGHRLDVIRTPTWETPPGGLEDWLPQRLRWIKGFMQTWGVHTRRPWELGLRGGLSLVMTLGMALASAAIHAPSVALVASAVLTALAAGLTPATPIMALGVLTGGTVAAWISAGIGAHRAGLAYGPRAMVEAPAYWSLLTLAFALAAWRLIRDPFGWDKTRHRPDLPAEAGPGAAAGPISAA